MLGLKLNHVSKRGHRSKWPPRYLQMHFREWKMLYSDSNFPEVCSHGSNWQWPCDGLDNGLVPNRLQAIIWTNADPIHWRIYAALGWDESSENEASLKNMGRWITWIQHLLGRKTTKASLPGQYKSPWEQQDFGLRLKLRSWLIFTGGGQGNLPLRKDS